MALNSDAILTRIREVIGGTGGSGRLPDEGVYLAGLYAGQSSEESSRLAMHVARFEPKITGSRRHPASPSYQHSLAFREIDVEIAVARHLNDKHRLSSSYRDDVHALGSNDADAISQALGWPGNLTATNAAVATGIVSGLLEYVDSEIRREELGDDQAGLVEWVHRFRGVVQITQDTES